MSKPKTVTYKTIGGCEIKADIYLPGLWFPPVVVYLHGGALISGSRKYLPSSLARKLVNAGKAVVSCDYRLAPETRLEEILSDVHDALDWVRGPCAAEHGLDPDQVAVMGGSAGGYLSLMCGTFAVKPAAIVSFYGYGDILGDWYTRPSEHYRSVMRLITKQEAEKCVGGPEKSSGGNRRYAYYFYCRQQGIWPEAVSGKNPLTEGDSLRRFCPLDNISPDFPPTLLLHGDQDSDVPYEQSLRMAAALQKHGIENQLITVAGGEHGFDADQKNPAVRVIFDQVAAFLRRHLE